MKRALLSTRTETKVRKHRGCGFYPGRYSLLRRLCCGWGILQLRVYSSPFAVGHPGGGHRAGHSRRQRGFGPGGHRGGQGAAAVPCHGGAGAGGRVEEGGWPQPGVQTRGRPRKTR